MRIGKFLDDNCRVIYSIVILVMFISILMLNHCCNQWRHRFEVEDRLSDDLIEENHKLKDIISKNHIELPKN